MQSALGSLRLKKRSLASQSSGKATCAPENHAFKGGDGRSLRPEQGQARHFAWLPILAGRGVLPPSTPEGMVCKVEI